MLTDGSDDEGFIDIQPWPVQELVGRLVCLTSLGRRGAIEAEATGDLFEAETDRFDLQAWAELELGPWLSTTEARILRTPVSGLSDDDLAACADALSASCAIGWAVRVLPDTTLRVALDNADELRVLEWSPGPWRKVREITRQVRLRSDQELADEREKWDIVVWRLSLFQDANDDAVDQAALVDVLAEVTELGKLRTDGTDLVTADGAPFSAFAEEELAKLEHHAALRLRALNWVCGLGQDWDSAPLILD